MQKQTMLNINIGYLSHRNNNVTGKINHKVIKQKDMKEIIEMRTVWQQQ